MTVKVRYKTPQADTSKLAEFPVRKAEPRMSHNLGFAAAVAEFGMLLRRSEFSGAATWQQAMSLATDHRGEDRDGYRAEFVRLVDEHNAMCADPELQSIVPVGSLGDIEGLPMLAYTRELIEALFAAR